MREIGPKMNLLVLNWSAGYCNSGAVL